MTILFWPEPEPHFDLWCDGCGELVQIEGDEWRFVLSEVSFLGWHTIERDVEYAGENDNNVYYEHFCSDECLDDDD